jgi:hypothetical protein
MKKLLAIGSLAAACATGCVVDQNVAPQESDLTSTSAIFLELSFSGRVVGPATDSAAQQRKQVVTQLFYMAGELDKVHGGHGQFGFVKLDNLQSEAQGDDLVVTTYDAKLPVAWPKWREVPESYRVVVPLRVDDEGLDTFNNQYAGTCGKAKYGADSLWYDFEPVTTACEMDPADIVDTVAAVAPSPDVTTDKRPEFEKFWDDGEFRAVIVHGTDGAWSKDESDIGVREYLDFQEQVKRAYPEAEITTGATNYSIFDDWTLTVPVPTYGGGEGRLIVTTLLTAPLESIGSDFDARFGPLSRDADLITYGGHSGLSENIKALAAREQVKEQHYQVYFLDGCSTFAYLDSTLVDRRIELNGAEIDPQGTKFLDMIVNAQPAPWYTGADSQWTILSHLAGTEQVSYLDILDDLSQAATPVVSGEEDNPSISE